MTRCLRSILSPNDFWSRGGGKFTVVALILFTLILSGANTQTSFAATKISDAEFQEWIRGFRQDAERRGISRKTLDQAFAGISSPRKSVVRAKSNQPEVTRTSAEYISSLVSEKRVEAGRESFDNHSALLAAVKNAYGVEPHIIAAIWGVETFYGRLVGKHNIIQALATLAATHKRRARYWREELFAALKILDAGHITPGNLRGSWAGAMGHIQFMPTTYQRYAVDFDRDGQADIWQSEADALASAAKFLKAKGWQKNQPWGFEVRLPRNFDFALAAPETKRTLAFWRDRGVVPAQGIGWPDVDGDLQLMLPSGAQGPAFLITKNFRVLMRYNPSTRYALAVAHLSDRIVGGPGFAQNWPEGQRSLKSVERKELQRLLSAQGHKIGPVDGIIGRGTRQAIRAFQTAAGLPADGHPSEQLLEQLRAAQ